MIRSTCSIPSGSDATDTRRRRHQRQIKTIRRRRWMRRQMSIAIGDVMLAVMIGVFTALFVILLWG